MMSEMGLCTWDPASVVLTTLRESAKNHNLAELKKAAWYNDAFEDLGVAKQGGLNPPLSLCSTWTKTAPSRPSIYAMAIGLLLPQVVCLHPKRS